jgi:F-type H+-transporting ATPase subunit b
MLIDWFTIAAQVLNFLILVWLMKRFLYKPILDAIDAREERIAAKIADADAKKADAEKAHETFQEKNVEIDRRRDAILHQAEEEAQAERRRLIDEARQAADALRAQRQAALEREQQHLNDEITRRTKKEVFAIARNLPGKKRGNRPPA